MFGAPILEGAGDVYGSVRWIAFALLPLVTIITAVYYQYRALDPGDGLSVITVVRRLVMCSILLVLYPYLIHTLVYLSTWISNSIFTSKQAAVMFIEMKSKIYQNLEKMNSGDPLSIFSLDYSSFFATAAMTIGYGAHQIAEFMTKLVFTYLYVLGPLAIAIAVVPGSTTLSGWGGSILQVSTWPIAYAILYRLAMASGRVADISDQNTVTAFLASIVFAVAILFTPLFARMLFSSSAATQAGALGNIVSAKLGMDTLRRGAHLATSAAKSGPSTIGKIAGGLGASGRAASDVAGGVSMRKIDVPRPGDKL